MSDPTTCCCRLLKAAGMPLSAGVTLSPSDLAGYVDNHSMYQGFSDSCMHRLACLL